MKTQLDRRSFIAATTAGAALAAQPARSEGQAGAAPVAAVYTPKPMPFDPKAVEGFSEKVLVSHYENNYLGAVKRLNAILAKLATLDFDKATSFELNGLKREELLATNSMILHEIYFAGVGPANRPGPELAEAIARDFGSFDAWKTQFGAMGRALGGGSGWVVLAWDRRGRRLVNAWGADHTHFVAGAEPILALDMYEHSYHMDFGTKAGDYVKASMAATNWGAADALFAKRG
jgi:Fe-Mn family superoxide dismutase